MSFVYRNSKGAVRTQRKAKSHLMPLQYILDLLFHVETRLDLQEDSKMFSADAEEKHGFSEIPRKTRYNKERPWTSRAV